jgi:SAM-dependent MidA family methyltransferase
MSEFETETESAALKEAIVARIERDGGITFRDFMEMALYEPRLGYYCSQRTQVGREGDYLTSPEVSPLFGAMIGRQLHEMWDSLGRPGRFQVVEAGAGSGRLCLDILRWAARTSRPLAGAIDYVLIDASPAMVERQKRTLADDSLSDSVRWSEAMPRGVVGCILSNELLDAIPVHRVALEGGTLRETYVESHEGGLSESLRDASTPDIERYFERLGLLPGEGCRAEVNLAALDWVAHAARSLERGFLMTLDYGYEAEELYAPWRREGTLLCFYRHNPSTDPYSRIGRQDMTSHIDLTSVRAAGEEAGVTTLGTISQSEFLLNLGIAEAMAPPTEGETDLEEYYARRNVALELLDPGGLGRIRVLTQAKGIGDIALTGLKTDQTDA